MSFAPEPLRSLAPLTTLELGGAARYFARIDSRALLVEALRWARAESVPVYVLGAGSNLVVADAGVDGLVLQLALRGVELDARSDRTCLTAAAGEPWQEVVDLALERNLAGLECLTGIPGLAGATPIQNVGAYGQEVSESIDAVEVLDRESLQSSWLLPAQCGFGYRDSRFKHEPERFVVLSVRFKLTPGGAPKVAYAEVSHKLQACKTVPRLLDVAAAVLELRRSKSMVLDPSDENRRSAGSFFTNPIVTNDVAAELFQREPGLPQFVQPDGRVKLAAAWLIERAGFAKGMRRGAVGISSKHSLALVHHGGARTSELLTFADEIRAAVQSRFGLRLALEPVCW